MKKDLIERRQQLADGISRCGDDDISGAVKIGQPGNLAGHVPAFRGDEIHRSRNIQICIDMDRMLGVRRLRSIGGDLEVLRWMVTIDLPDRYDSPVAISV